MVVVPKSTNPARIIENLKARDVKLDAEDMKRLTEIKTDVKLITVSSSIRVSFHELVMYAKQ